MGGRDLFNVVSHLMGTVFAAVATVVLVSRPLHEGQPSTAAAFAVFGLTLVLAYAVSTMFHATTGRLRNTFRRLDRTAIYLLILGGYAPLALIVLPVNWGIPLLVVATCGAAIGVANEVRDVHASSSVALYLALGWLGVVAMKPLADRLAPEGLALLVGGGLLYTVGAVTVRFRLTRRSHEVWHVLALAASACHVAMAYFFIH
jgi:hemolysin III